MREVSRLNRWREKGFPRQRRAEKCRAGYLSSSDNTPLAQVPEDARRLVLRRQRGRVEGQLGLERGLVRVVDAGEPLDLAGAGLLVEALGVALLARLDRRVHEHLDERQAGLDVQLADE